ncbi:MAG TPA: hypothetical protein VKX39_00030 [Bryobacteraceae bacterium]|nr:hypothetical protein [Bryobacteraceae bacterium]
MTDLPRRSEPRWPALIALLSIGALHYALPSNLTIGPDWLLLALVIALATPAIVSMRYGYPRIAQIFGYAVSGIVTAALIVSLSLLVERLPSHRESPRELLLSAAALWVCNVLVFACWYWRLDAGGPHQRDLKWSHTDGAFLFPQMMLDRILRREMGEEQWRPGFVDYLFLAFTASTAFSPTDVPVLSRWAKGLMMVQSMISLGTVAIIAARAVNVL